MHTGIVLINQWDFLHDNVSYSNYSRFNNLQSNNWNFKLSKNYKDELYNSLYEDSSNIPVRNVHLFKPSPLAIALLTNAAPRLFNLFSKNYFTLLSAAYWMVSVYIYIYITNNDTKLI